MEVVGDAETKSEEHQRPKSARPDIADDVTKQKTDYDENEWENWFCLMFKIVNSACNKACQEDRNVA